MAIVDISLVHMAPVDRNLRALEVKSWLSPDRPVGIGLGDRFGVPQGVSGLFRGGVRLGTKIR
jgi:hypothetical protein